jgi:hypothetical protein
VKHGKNTKKKQFNEGTDKTTKQGNSYIVLFADVWCVAENSPTDDFEPGQISLNHSKHNNSNNFEMRPNSSTQSDNKKYQTNERIQDCSPEYQKFNKKYRPTLLTSSKICWYCYLE